MRVLCAAVLSMESILMGFALLIAKDQASIDQIWFGAAIAILYLGRKGEAIKAIKIASLDKDGPNQR